MVPAIISDWRRCWRSKAMRLLAFGGAIQGAVVTCPAAISDHLPSWVMQTASTFSFICMVLAGMGLGKESRKEKTDVQSSDADH